MPKYVVRQKLAPGSDINRDHLHPLARVVAISLDPAASTSVVWLWGYADLDSQEYTMLFQAPDESTLLQSVGHTPGLVSVTRVLFVDKDNLASVILKGMAEQYEPNPPRTRDEPSRMSRE
jgi:hypothetical protein